MTPIFIEAVLPDDPAAGACTHCVPRDPPRFYLVRGPFLGRQTKPIWSKRCFCWAPTFMFPARIWLTHFPSRMPLSVQPIGTNEWPSRSTNCTNAANFSSNAAFNGSHMNPSSLSFERCSGDNRIFPSRTKLTQLPSATSPSLCNEGTLTWPCLALNRFSSSKF